MLLNTARESVRIALGILRVSMASNRPFESFALYHFLTFESCPAQPLILNSLLSRHPDT